MTQSLLSTSKMSKILTENQVLMNIHEYANELISILLLHTKVQCLSLS